MSASDAAESSRASQKPVPEPEPSVEEVPPPPPQPSWVVLASTPSVISNGVEPVDMILPGRDVLLTNPLHDPPRPCLLFLYPHLAPDIEHNAAHGYIHATHSSGRIVFRVLQGGRDDLYLCDIYRRTAPRLPSVPTEELGLVPGQGILPGRSIGLIADTRLPLLDHYMIAQMQPRGHIIAFPGRDMLLFYLTLSSRWFAKPLDSAPGRIAIPAEDHGVLTHAGMLCWVALNHGLFFCDPFPVQPRLDFVPFPDAHERLDEVVDAATPIDQRRGVRLSQGRLRFVDIRGLATDPTGDNPLCFWMFTLADPELGNPERRWTLDCRVPFSEIWAHQSYIDAGLPLPQNRMPHLAFLHPGNHQVVYFFLDSWIFGVDLSDRHVVDYHLCSMDDGRVRDLRFESSRPIVDALELLPPPPAFLLPPPPPPSSSNGDDDVDEDGLAIEWVTSWLNKTVSTIQEGEGQSSSAGEPGSTI